MWTSCVLCESADGAVTSVLLLGERKPSSGSTPTGTGRLRGHSLHHGISGSSRAALSTHAATMTKEGDDGPEKQMERAMKLRRPTSTRFTARRAQPISVLPSVHTVVLSEIPTKAPLDPPPVTAVATVTTFSSHLRHEGPCRVTRLPAVGWQGERMVVIGSPAKFLQQTPRLIAGFGRCQLVTDGPVSWCRVRAHVFRRKRTCRLQCRKVGICSASVTSLLVHGSHFVICDGAAAFDLERQQRLDRAGHAPPGSPTLRSSTARPSQHRRTCTRDQQIRV